MAADNSSGERGSGAEERLVLLSARPNPCAETSRVILSLAGGSLDWGRVESLALAQGTLQLLCRNLAACAPGKVPVAVTTRLRDIFKRQARNNLILAGELIRLLEECAAREINALAFKGPLLAQELYGNLALRSYSDLDFLISRRDLPAFAVLLASRDYAVLPGLEQAVRAARSVPAALLPDQVGFSRRRDRLHVEAHLEVPSGDFAPSFRLGGDTGQLPRQRFFNRLFPTLGPEDLLLYLSVHGCKHLWDQLSLTSDLAALVDRHPDLDWQGLLHRAGTTGFRRMLLLGLFLGRENMGLRLPREVLAAVAADPEVRSLAAELRGGGLPRSFDSWPPGRRRRLQLRMWEGRGNRLRFLRRLVLSPRLADYRVVRLPGFLFGGYVAVRIIRLMVKHGAGLDGEGRRAHGGGAHGENE